MQRGLNKSIPGLRLERTNAVGFPGADPVVTESITIWLYELHIYIYIYIFQFKDTGYLRRLPIQKNMTLIPTLTYDHPLLILKNPNNCI